MCRLSWFLDPGGWSKTATVSLYFIFPGICTLSLHLTYTIAHTQILSRVHYFWSLEKNNVAAILRQENYETPLTLLMVLVLVLLVMIDEDSDSCNDICHDFDVAATDDDCGNSNTNNDEYSIHIFC
ncbi:hypothetical protein STEG23_004044 [Scotinomys teguina]